MARPSPTDVPFLCAPRASPLFSSVQIAPLLMTPSTGLAPWRRSTALALGVLLLLTSPALSLRWAIRSPRRVSKWLMMGDRPSTIVGLGRIGSLLANSGAGQDLLVGRDGSIDAGGSGPIYVCTRNNVLDEIVDKCPENRREDLVFLQNGFIESWLKGRGLEDNTQALLYFAVPKVGAEPIDGVTRLNSEGLTTVTGKWGQALSERLAKAGLKCNNVDETTYRKKMFEKLLWICCYMLVGAVRDCGSVGEAQELHANELESLVSELVAAIGKRYSITFEPGVTERLAAYTEVVSSFPCGVKEFEWRNGFFWALGRQSVKERGSESADECPLHSALLRVLAQQGKISFELPEEPDMKLLMGTIA